MYYKKMEDARCHVGKLFNLMDGKWNVMLICALSDCEPVRYGELKRRMNHITDTALTNALKSLQNMKIIERYAYNEVPPRVEYCLTQKGAELVPIVKSACQWSLRYDGPENDRYCWRCRYRQKDK